MKKQGFGRAKALLNKISPEIEAQFDKANKDNAEMIVDLARVLIPEVSGDSRREINNYPAPEGGQLIDFGKKAKVIEGDKGPRPFVNPALAGTKKKRAERNRKAIRDAARMIK